MSNQVFYTPTRRPVKRVGLYGRVSSPKQEDNTSLVNQIDKGQTFALEHGLEVIGEKTEVITGASRWGARTKFNEYLEMGDQGLLDAIVVDVPDRLGRGRALATLLDRTEKHGLALLFANGEEIDTVSLGVNIIKSGGERENISRRVREGKLKTAQLGEVVFSNAPYGFQIIREYDPQTGKKISATVEPEPEETQDVINIFNWLVFERQSLRGIQSKLYENEVLPPGIKKRMLKRYGEASWDKVPDEWSKDWSRQTIKRVLSNEIYMGKWWFNRKETKWVESGDRMKQVIVRERDRSDWVCVDVPAMISEELFEIAQSILRENKKQFAGRPSKYQYLLKGMLFCLCGRKMVGSGKRGAYRCTRNTTPISEEKQGCPYPNQDLIENTMWDYIKGLMLHPERLLDEFEERQREAEKKNAFLLEQAEGLQADIHKSKVKLDNLLDLFLAEEVDKKTYKRKKKEIKNAIKDTKRELARVRAQLEKEPLTEDHKAQLLEFCEKMQKGLEIANFEDKRQLLKILDVRVSLLPEEDTIMVQGAFPSEKIVMHNQL